MIKGGVGLEIKYDDGSEFSFSPVQVFAPGQAEAFQTGATDAKGRFFFSPDRPGTWKVLANDGMGHGVAAEVKVDAGLNIETAAAKAGWSRLTQLLVGLGLILGFTGIWFFLAARRMLKAGKT